MSNPRESLIRDHPPRIRPLRREEFTEETRQLVRMMGGLRDDPRQAQNAQEAEVSEMLGTMGRHPMLYASHLEMAKIFFNGALSHRDRELAILRVAWLCQAPFEWGEHVTLAKQVGLSSEDIERAIEGSRAEGWSDHERAIVRAVEELHGDAMISDETWAALDRGLDEKQLIELIMLVGQYQTVAYYQNSLRLRLREGNQGLNAR